MLKFELIFEAEEIHTSRNSRRNYRMVGFSNTSFPIKSYVILQREYIPNEKDEVYLEWNGNVGVNTISEATLSFQTFTLKFNNTRLVVELNSVSIDPRIISNLEFILGDKLIIKPLNELF